MSTPFELRLQEMTTAPGRIDADDLLAIVSSLKHIALALARDTAESRPRGRPNHQVERLASLQVALAPGSTRVQFERRPHDGALALDLSDETRVDAAFEDLIANMAENTRPAWVPEPVAAAVSELARALAKAAPRVEFSANGNIRATIRTPSLQPDVWKLRTADAEEDVVAYVGLLEKVDLHSGDFRMRDDAGHTYALPAIAQPTAVSHLIGTHVLAEGKAERNAEGQVHRIRTAALTAAPDPLAGSAVPPDRSLDLILGSSAGPLPGGVSGLSDDEVDVFLTALQR